MKFVIKVTFVIFILINISFPQQILTLNDALSIALNKSYDIKSAELALTNTQKSLEAARLGLMTSINMDFVLPNYSRTLSNQFDPITGSQQFFDYGYTTYESRLYFTQPLIFTNGTFTLNGQLWRRSQFSSGRQIPEDYYSNITFSYQQPLFAFNSLRATLNRAEINYEKAQRNYSSASQDIIYNVESGFYILYQARENVLIAREKVKQTESSFQTAQNKFKAGLIAEVEALQLEVDLASSKNDLINSERNYIEANNNFKLLIGLSLNDNIEVAAKIEYNPVSINLTEAINYALENRGELKNSEDDIELAEMSVDEINSQGNITALITANYGINKDDYSFSDIFHQFDGSRSVAFTIHVPVFDWGENNRKVEAAEANLELNKLTLKNQKEQVEKEVMEAVNRINSAKARVEALSKSILLAKKSFEISQQRFQAGTITSFELQQMQLRLTDAKINSLNALIDYKLSLADLNRKTLHDFSK